MAPNQIHVEICKIPLQKVTVFPDGAEVSRQFSTDLVEGINEIHVEYISEKATQDSFRVSGSGDALIHEVLHRSDTVEEDELSNEKVVSLRQEVKKQNEALQDIKDQGAVMEKRRDALDSALKLITQNSKEANVDDQFLTGFEKFHEYYDTQSRKIRAEIRRLRSELTDREKEFNDVEKKLLTVLKDTRKQRKICIILLESRTGGPVSLKMVYHVTNCSWKPSYDIRVDDDVKSSAKLFYYAKIYQQSGEDWVDAPLVLSTGQSSTNERLPELGTLEATYHPPEATRHRQDMQFHPPYNALFGSACFGAMPQQQQLQEPPPREPEPVIEHVEVASVKKQILRTEFVIARPANIPSNADYHKVTIGTVSLEPKLVNECVPTKNTSVFLIATALNESNLPMLPGDAFVFINNTFASQVTLKTVMPKERFSFSLGVDPSVFLEYQSVGKYQEKGAGFSNVVGVTNEHQITLKNNKETPIFVIVKVPIPKSKDDRVKFHLVCPNITNHGKGKSTDGADPEEGAILNSSNNLEWTVRLESKDEETLNVKWISDYPQGGHIRFIEKFVE